MTLLAKYHFDDQIKKDETVEACSTHGRKYKAHTEL
jgi:hypothetical protein